jgi:hypothetical protein
MRFNYLRPVLKLFLGNRAGVLLLIPVLIAVYFFMNYQSDYYTASATTNLGLWGEAVVFPVSGNIIAALFICLNALAINWIYNTNEFLERNSYLSSLLYVVLMSFYHSFYSVDGLLIAHSCLILTLYQFFELRQNEDGRRHVFNGAFFAGLAASFHPPMVALIPFILIMIWNIRPFIFRETLLALIGFSIPLLYGGVYLWYSGHSIELKILEQATNYYKKQTDFLVTAVLFTLLFLLSLVSIRGKMQKSSIRLKKLVRMLWWLVAVGILFGLGDFIFFRQIERFSFLMIPLSFFLTFSFTDKTFGISASILFYLTFVYSLINFFL